MTLPINTNIAGDAGWLGNDVPVLPPNLTGAEVTNVDTQHTAGSVPLGGVANLQQLATDFLFFTSQKDKTPVSGSIYYTQVNVGFATQVNGIEVLVGSAGGTDNWYAGLYNSAGALVASSTLSGTTAGTASTWQQLALTAAATIQPGIYYIALQSNGTTAHFASYNAPTGTLSNGSQTGSAGTLATITPPGTYTANVGPISRLY